LNNQKNKEVVMKKRFIPGVAALTTSMLLSIGSVGAADKAKSDHPDWEFFKKAAQGGMAEVTLGQMAASKAESEAVKNFGQRMVTDHGKASQELKDLAAAENVTLPTEMSADAKALQEKLSGLSGAEFDKAYMEEMLKDHKTDISAFQEQAQQGKDPEVKNWAEKTLPTLQEHYTLAETTSSKIGVKSSDMSSSSMSEPSAASTHSHMGAADSGSSMK
jgi:putative membrane protein